MNIAKMIVGIQTELKKKRKDRDLHCALTAIIDELCLDQFDSNSNCITFRQIYGNINYAGADYLEDKQRLLEFKKSKLQIEKLAIKLRKFGFKCRPVSRFTKGIPCYNGRICFEQPFIEIKFK